MAVYLIINSHKKLIFKKIYFKLYLSYSNISNHFKSKKKNEHWTECQCQHPYGHLLQVMSALLLIPLPVNCLGMEGRNGPSLWCPALIWQTQKFLYPGFELAQHWLL